MQEKIQHHDNKVTLAFRALDKDGSGTVETAEFKHLMTHVGQYLSLYFLLVLSLFLYRTLSLPLPLFSRALCFTCS